MNEFSAIIKDNNLVDSAQHKTYEHKIFYEDDKYFLNGDFRFFDSILEPLDSMAIDSKNINSVLDAIKAFKEFYCLKVK